MHLFIALTVLCVCFVDAFVFVEFVVVSFVHLLCRCFMAVIVKVEYSFSSLYFSFLKGFVYKRIRRKTLFHILSICSLYICYPGEENEVLFMSIFVIKEIRENILLFPSSSFSSIFIFICYPNEENAIYLLICFAFMFILSKWRLIFWNNKIWLLLEKVKKIIIVMLDE